MSFAGQLMCAGGGGNGASVAVGAGTLVSAGSNEGPYGMVKLDDRKYLLVDLHGTNGMYARVVTVASDGTMTSGTPVQVSSSVAALLKVVRLSPTLAMVVFGNASAYLYGVALSVSGSTITMGSVVTVYGTACLDFKVAELSATAALVWMRESAGPNAHKMVVVTASGTTLTVNTVFDPSLTGALNSLVALATNSVLIQVNGSLRIVSVSGTTPSVAVALTDAVTRSMLLLLPGSGRVLAVSPGSGHFNAQVLSISGGLASVVVADTAMPTRIGSSTTFGISVATSLAGDKVLLGYAETRLGAYSTSLVVAVAGPGSIDVVSNTELGTSTLANPIFMAGLSALEVVATYKPGGGAPHAAITGVAAFIARLG